MQWFAVFACLCDIGYSSYICSHYCPYHIGRHFVHWWTCQRNGPVFSFYNAKELMMPMQYWMSISSVLDMLSLTILWLMKYYRMTAMNRLMCNGQTMWPIFWTRPGQKWWCVHQCYGCIKLCLNHWHIMIATDQVFPTSRWYTPLFKGKWYNNKYSYFQCGISCIVSHSRHAAVFLSTFTCTCTQDIVQTAARVSRQRHGWSNSHNNPGAVATTR